MPHGKHGPVTMKPVANSSSIEAWGYDTDRKELHVKFKSGAPGHYSNVDHDTWVVLQGAPSKGKALHALIKKAPQKHPWISHKK